MWQFFPVPVYDDLSRDSYLFLFLQFATSWITTFLSYKHYIFISKYYSYYITKNTHTHVYPALCRAVMDTNPPVPGWNTAVRPFNARWSYCVNTLTSYMLSTKKSLCFDTWILELPVHTWCGEKRRKCHCYYEIRMHLLWRLAIADFLYKHVWSTLLNYKRPIRYSVNSIMSFMNVRSVSSRKWNRCSVSRYVMYPCMYEHMYIMCVSTDRTFY